MNKNDVKTIKDLVTAAAGEYGDKIFVKEKKGAEVVGYSFNQFLEDVKKTANYVNSKKSGDKIHAAVIGPSSYAWLVGWFGTVCGGNTAVPLDAQLPPAELCELLVRSDTEIFFYDSRYEKMIPAVKQNCPNVREYISFGEGLPELLEKYEAAALPEIAPDALAAISYTSGTTGKSKGVMLLNSNYIDNAMCQDGEGTTEDVLMSVLPIHHIYCFTCDVLLSLRYGMELCFNDSMLHITQNLQVFKPTAILIVPMIAETIYNKMKAAAASKPDVPMAMIAQGVFGGRLQVIFSGGAYLRPELQKAYIDMGIKMSQGYGMTECAPRISTADRDDTSCAGDVGVIVNGAQVKIVEDEIWVKSPSVMAGYYKDPEETAKTLTPDGWLMTGDLGYVDEKNRIFITGRKKNLIILSNGENVSPEELENKFAGIPYIAEVLVSGEEGVITAEIFPNPEYTAANPDADIEKMFRDTVDEINKTVTSAKTIRRLRIRDTEFDKTTSKKIIRKQSVKGREIT